MGSASLIGKLPSQPDFVRLNCDEAAVRFDQWLVRAVEVLHGVRLVVPPRVYHFVLREPGGQALFAGVLTASQDQIGRRFPVATFVPCVGAPGRRGLTDALDSAGPPLAAMHELAMELPVLRPDEAAERLAAIPEPGSAVLPGADSAGLRRAHDVTLAETFLRGTLGDSPEAWSYALSTFAQALRMSGAASVGAAPLVLRCPSRGVGDVVAWLSLGDALVGQGDAVVGALWDAGQPTDALLCIGDIAPSLLRFACDPSSQAHNLWPLTTQVPEALAAAHGALGPMVAAQTRAGATLPALWAAQGELGR